MAVKKRKRKAPSKQKRKPPAIEPPEGFDAVVAQLGDSTLPLLPTVKRAIDQLNAEPDPAIRRTMLAGAAQAVGPKLTELVKGRNDQLAMSAIQAFSKLRGQEVELEKARLLWGEKALQALSNIELGRLQASVMGDRQGPMNTDALLMLIQEVVPQLADMVEIHNQRPRLPVVDVAKGVGGE